VLAQLTKLVYRRRRLVVLVWIGLLVLTATLGGRFGGDGATDYGTPGSESAAANDLLEERFPAGFGDTIEVVWRADDVSDPGIRGRATAFLDDAAALDHVAAVAEGSNSADGAVAYATLQLDTWDMPVEVTRELLDAAEEADGDGFTIDLAGNPVQTAEQGEV